MTRTNETGPAPDAPAPTAHSGPAPASTIPAPRVLVVDADRALFGLIEEWLQSEGCAVVAQGGADRLEDESFDLVIADLPYPRDCGVDSISRLSKRHPMTPILALSSTFFARIECCGPVSRALGVACVLPKPVSRQALIDAVRRALPA